MVMDTWKMNQTTLHNPSMSTPQTLVNQILDCVPPSNTRPPTPPPSTMPPNAQSFGSHTHPESLNLAQHHLQPPQSLPQHPLLTAGQAKAKSATRGRTRTTYSCELLSDPTDQQEQCRRIRVIAYSHMEEGFEVRYSEL